MYRAFKSTCYLLLLIQLYAIVCIVSFVVDDKSQFSLLLYRPNFVGSELLVCSYENWKSLKGRWKWSVLFLTFYFTHCSKIWKRKEALYKRSIVIAERLNSTQINEKTVSLSNNLALLHARREFFSQITSAAARLQSSPPIRTRKKLFIKIISTIMKPQ